MLQKLAHPSFPAGITVLHHNQTVVGIGPVARSGENDSPGGMPHQYQNVNTLAWRIMSRSVPEKALTRCFTRCLTRCFTRCLT